MEGIMYILNEATLSKKLIIKADSSKNQKFIEKVIKEYKLSADKGDYIFKNNVFTLFNTNQYNFTDIRNDAYKSKVEYEEI